MASMRFIVPCGGWTGGCAVGAAFAFGSGEGANRIVSVGLTVLTATAPVSPPVSFSIQKELTPITTAANPIRSFLPTKQLYFGCSVSERTACSILLIGVRHDHNHPIIRSQNET